MIITTQGSKPTTVQIKDAPYGVPFKRNCGTTMMRLKPTSFILNSNLVTEVLNRGDVFCSNLITGTLYVLKGIEEIR